MKEAKIFWLTIVSMILVFALVACTPSGKEEEKATEAPTVAASTAAPTKAATNDSVAPGASSSYQWPTLDYSLPTLPKFEVGTYEYHMPTIHLELPSIAPINLDLYAGLDLSGIDGVTQDERGALSLDAQVLFDYDSAELSETGKKDLKKFIDQYAEAITSEKNKGKVSRIIVEGHTDTKGSYDYNKTLSEKRANNVLNYCVKLHPELKSIMVAKGCSYDYPVKKADGSIDMAASRRVCFVAE